MTERSHDEIMRFLEGLQGTLDDLRNRLARCEQNLLGLSVKVSEFGARGRRQVLGYGAGGVGAAGIGALIFLWMKKQLGL